MQSALGSAGVAAAPVGVALTEAAVLGSSGRSHGERAAVGSPEGFTTVAVGGVPFPSADVARVNLIPTMPPHVAFWFGARLGYTHDCDVIVHSIRQGDGAPAYSPAVSLRTTESVGEPALLVDRLEAIDDGDLRR